jgi:copper chaperone CopZ
MTTTLKIEGMSCGHCVRSVRNALTAVAGVEAADVVLEPGSAIVTHSEDAAHAAMIAAVEAEGFRATLE